MNKEVYPLGKFCKIRRGASPRPIDNPEYFGGKVGWIRISDVTKSNKYLLRTEQYLSELGESKSVRVNKGDLVMSICGTIGRPIIVGIPSCIHDGFVQLYDFDKNAFIEYFYYLLQFHAKGLESKGQPGTQVNLNSTIVAQYEAFIPSLIEQKKIADVLTSVDRVIELTSMEIDKLKDLKKGMMQELLTKGIGHKKFKDSPGGKIPESWKKEPIKQFAKIGTGGKDAQDKVDGGKYPFYVRSAKIERINSYSFDGVAVLTVGDGVGTGKVFHFINGKCEIHQRVYKIYDFKNYIEPKFFFYYFAEYFNLRVQALSAKNSVDSVRMEMISEMDINVPPISEQKKIAENLNSVDRKIELALIKSEKLKIIKKGLMNDLLTGKVRVKV